MPSLSWDFPYPSQRMPVLARNVVATSHPLAAQAGLQMRMAGGNVVDMALAAAITLTVVEPVSNGLGGDAFALIWESGELHGFNGSGRAPAAWSPARFADRSVMPESGWDTVTVPGAVDAWYRIWRRFGRLPFARLFEPAVRYAESGYLVSPIISRAWRKGERLFGRMAAFAETFLPGGHAPSPGERFSCPELARTLQEIAETDGRSFYTGRLAEQIAADAKRWGGAMVEADLAAHAGEWVTPLGLDYHGVRLHEIPPNGQGMAALISLGILARHDIRGVSPDSAESVHFQVEAMKAAFSVAYARIADADHMTVDPRALLSDGFLDEMAVRIQADRASRPEPVRRSEQGTVYLTAADDDGMMVSLIQSNYTGFGSGVVVPGTGISLHSRGRGFNLTPGHPNCVGGGKRPFHTIIPGFVTRAGEALMSFGVMGAPMQPQGHLQMMVRVCDQGQNPQAASDAPRWYVWEDGSVSLEPGFPESVRAGLEARGHRVRPDPPDWGFGGAQLIYRLSDGYVAASDHRKDGQALGY